MPRFGQHGPWTSPEGYGIWSADRGVPPPGPQGGRGTRTTEPVTEPVIVAAEILSDVHEKLDASVLWRRARRKEPARGADGLLRRDLRTAVRGGQPARLALDPDPGGSSKSSGGRMAGMGREGLLGRGLSPIVPALRYLRFRHSGPGSVSGVNSSRNSSRTAPPSLVQISLVVIDPGLRRGDGEVDVANTSVPNGATRNDSSTCGRAA